MKTHFMAALLSTTLLVLAHSFVMFFLIATGVEMKELEKAARLGRLLPPPDRCPEVADLPLLTGALLLVIANFILGAAVHTRALPAWVHEGTAWATLATCLAALVRSWRVLGDNNRLIAEVASRREDSPPRPPDRDQSFKVLIWRWLSPSPSLVSPLQHEGSSATGHQRGGRRREMNRVIVSGLALLTAASLAACQRTPASDKAAEELKAEKERTAALELRIAELERKAAEVPAPVINLPAPRTYLQAPAAPGAVRRARPLRRSRRPARASRSSPTSRSALEEPAERTERSRDRERDPWAATGDPGPRREEVPAGTALTLVLETPLSTETTQEGQSVTARVESASSEDGRVVLPGGSVLRGRVTEVDRAGRVSGRAHLAVKWDTLTVRGESHQIAVSDLAMTAEKQHGRDAKIIGGSTAAGAIIGGIVNGGSGAKKGAIIGAGAGAGAVLVNKGQDVEMPAGSRWTVRVKETVRI